ncbi:Dimethylaniline monooxygenase [N-oxide-forming] 2 [Hypsizygus marmoreus]|uniref:Dimethylaniline monooxygenase [N-oxide-forming] 2 n=1 Tax=Hypsizygus marmoreus TaxID=39966 RepID=A0A369JWW0_HYPMA|nr:Dimethylaniline monooxygenase [N-oxide-forming] 2 [Hypsizygus marmoreus]
MATAATQAGAIAVIGAGPAGLITAHVLLRDGFDVQVLTRDTSPGGAWARGRVYPGLKLNNVHGEYRFSALPMPLPAHAAETGGRLSGDDMCKYMETFAETYLHGRIRYGTEVLSVRRSPRAGTWLVTVQSVGGDGGREVLEFARVVVCTGGTSQPNIPTSLSPKTAEGAGFRGLVLHSSQFSSRLDDILQTTKSPSSASDGDSIVIVGGGKSAQDIAAYLTNAGRKVTVVFETTDTVIAVPRPMPDFLRKSRLLGLLSPHIELQTRMERFFHMTWLGSKIVHFIWNKTSSDSLDLCKIPIDSPLRRAPLLFWGTHSSDEGIYSPNGFYGLVHAGQIALVAPVRAQGFGGDGRSLVLSDGKSIAADVVILATGYRSSWDGILDEETRNDLGIGLSLPDVNGDSAWENYTSLANPPSLSGEDANSEDRWSTSFYRGVVPAKNIERRDFAINGAAFAAGFAYTTEVSAHWISSYFLNDEMRLPASAEDAIACVARESAWVRKRHPGMMQWTNPSLCSSVSYFNWPQFVDELLEDMGVPTRRSGGNWLTWPFKVIDLKEIVNLGEERRLRRIGATS